MKPNTISLKEVIGRIKRHPMLVNISEDAIVDYTKEFFGILNLTEVFEEKIAIVDIDNYRGILPEDFYDVIQVRTYEPNGRPPIYFRSITDTFYNSDNKINSVSYAYKIQGSVIFTSPIKKGKIEIAYKAMQVDDCGYFVIPDNEKFIRALIAYVKLQEFTILFDMGQIKGDVLLNAQQEYGWAVGAAQTGLKMPSLDEMESISNMVNSILPRHSHNRGYADAGSAEIWRIQ